MSTRRKLGFGSRLAPAFCLLALVGVFAFVLCPPTQPRIIFAYGFDDSLHLLQPLTAPRWSLKAIIPGVAVPAYSQNTWNGSDIYVNGHCAGCGDALAPPGAVVAGSLPAGLAYAVRRPHAMYNHLSTPVYVWPGWVLGGAILLFGPYPAWVLLGRPIRRWRGSRHDLCVLCGYNLTGNTSGVCPECGNAL